MPGKNLVSVFDNLPINKIHEVSYAVIPGPAVPVSKPPSSELTEVNAWLGRKGINVSGLPEKSRREITHSSHPIFYKKGLDASADVIVKLEKEKDTYSPKVTTVWNR